MTSTTRGQVASGTRDGAPSTDDPEMVDVRSARDDIEVQSGASRWFAPAAIVGAVGLFALHAIQGAQVRSPVIFYDEGGYLGNARYMVSGYGRNGANYYAGYSIFLTPAAFFTHTAISFFHAVLVTNALLTLVTALFAVLLTRELVPQAARWVALVVAGIVAFCPFVFTFAGLAMSENALIPTVLLAAILVARAARTESRSARFGVVATSAFAYWITPRGVIVAGAGLIALALLTFEHRRSWRSFASESVAMALALGAGQLFENVVRSSGGVSGVSNRQHGLLTALVHPSDWRVWIAGVFGRFAYLGVASAGCILVGIAVAFVWVAAARRGRSESELALVRRGVSAFALFAVVGTVIADAAAVAGVPMLPRLDYFYYGRYAEAVAMPGLVIGASWLLTTACSPRGILRRRALVAALLTGSAIAVMAVLAREIASYRPLDSTVNSVNLLGLFAIREQLNVATVTKQLFVGAGIVAIVLLLVSYRARVFALLPVIVLGGASLVVHDQYLRHDSRIRATQNVLAHAIETLGANGVPTSCVDMERPIGSFWHLGNDQFLLPKTSFLRLSKGATASCPLVISSQMGLEWGAAHPSARLVTMENDVAMSLWIDLDHVSPAVRDRLARAGLYFPGSPCAALPTDAYRASLAASAQQRGTRPVDLSALRLSVDVRHDGRGSPWLGSRAAASIGGCGRVEIEADVEDAAGAVVFKRTIQTPRSLLPGEAWHLGSALGGPDLTPPVLSPGHTYRLVVRLVQQGVRYFGGADGAGVTIPLRSPR